MSRRRAAVLSALAGSDAFRSAQEVHGALRAAGDRVGLSTVYRVLQGLAEEGLLDVRRSDSGEAGYRRCAVRRHHHHLVCRGCGRTVEVEGPAVERWASRVAEAHDYAEVTHTVELTGTCPTCRRAARP